MHVIVVTGHRQYPQLNPANLATWRALAERLGTVDCHWAGVRTRCHEGSLNIVSRPRSPGVRSLLWAATSCVGVIQDVRRRRESGHGVLVVSGDPWSWVVGFVATRIHRTPWVVEVHGDLAYIPPRSVGRWRAFAFRHLTAAAASRADTVRTVAAPTAEFLRDRGANVENIPPRLLPLWEERAHRDHAPLRAEGWSILAVGRLVASKGFDILLDALALIDKDLRPSLRIVGDGPERDALWAKARELDIEQHVVLTGHLEAPQVREEMCRADVLVISSRDEGLPRTLLEAIACELPVVATEVGGIRSVAADLPTVTTVPPVPAALAAGMRAVRTSPPPMDLLRSGRELVLDQYGFANNIDALVAMYRRAAAR